jgi:hypothetical protein
VCFACSEDLVCGQAEARREIEFCGGAVKEGMNRKEILILVQDLFAVLLHARISPIFICYDQRRHSRVQYSWLARKMKIAVALGPFNHASKDVPGRYKALKAVLVNSHSIGLIHVDYACLWHYASWGHE